MDKADNREKYPVPMYYSVDWEIKVVAGHAVLEQKGVLALKGGPGGWHSIFDSPEKAVRVRYVGQQADITVSVITEKGYDKDCLARQIERAVTLAMFDRMRMRPHSVTVRFEEALTPTQLFEKYERGRYLH